MNTLVGQLRYLVGICCLTATAPAWAQETGARVTPELLQNRIAAAQDSTELDEATKARLVDLYRQSISNLEAHRANEESAEEYRMARRGAPAEAEKLRAALERRRTSDPTAGLQSLSSTSLQQLTRMLDEEVANLTAVEAKLAVLEARLLAAAQRPTDARARIAAARSLMEDLAAKSSDRSALTETPQTAEAARWAVEIRLEALRTEIEMLDEELLSHSARNDLLTAQKDEATHGVGRIRQRIEVLRTAVGERRRVDAELAMTQARAALAGASSGEPLVRELADANLILVELLQQQLSELDKLAALEGDRPRTTEIDNAYRSARRKLELEDSRAPVGMAILAERRQFPRARQYAKERRILSRSVVAVSLRLLEAEEERQALTDVGTYLDRRIAEAGEETLDSTVRGELESLVTTRRSLLDRAITDDVAQQQRLYELDDALRRSTDRMMAYDEFLAKRLLWVRSARAIDAASFGRLPGELADYLAPGPWLETAREAAVRLVRAPVSSLIVVLAFALTWRRRRIRASLVECGRNVGLVREDSMRSTVKALALTLILAAPVPLGLGAIGGALATAGDAAAFPIAVGSALLKTASWIALPLLMRALFLPGGVANRHFGWDDGVLAELRRQLAWFIGLFFPVYLVLRTSLVVEPPTYAGGTLTYLCFVGVMTGLLALIIGTGHPTKGTARQVLAARSAGAQWRWRYLGFPLAVLLPVALVVLGWFGYSYTAQELMRRLFQSIWFLVAIWLGAALVCRWLLMTSRRLTDQESPAASGTAPAQQAEGGDGTKVDGDVGGPEVDLVALNADSRKLLNAVVLLTVALVLAAIWGDVIPALSILEDVELWNQTALVDGVRQTVPVTLLDLLLAAVVGVVGYILARNVPSLLDIILLKQGSVSIGGRYTAGTLTRYAITAVTVLVVLQRLGASAWQLGWAAAALGVGIGFGLQEIVANFICGLILLFERPVRVGDVITIGDASGIVSKIRIRATTIRDWELKELVVPNKELITGRLLNWTLSDAVTRVFITVGVAYGSDVERAMALIREAAEENTHVVDEPEPRVHFEQFGDSSLNLTLRAYTSDVSNRLPVTTELHQAIDRKFRAAGIVIAFPQRDVHHHSGDAGAAPPIADGGESGKVG
jgi:potassium efflux system protein